MNKLFIIIGILMTSCATSYVAQSDIAISSWDESIVYIKDTELGKEIYEHWKDGDWGDSSTVILLSPEEFDNIYEKSYISKRGSKRW